MNFTTVSWLDVVMVLMLVGSIGFGFHQGLLRQLVLLLAIYVATVAAAQYYEQFTGVLLVYFTSSVEVDRAVSFLTLTVAFTLMSTWLIWSAYRQTKLPSVVMLDEVGGATLGGLIGVFVIGLTLSLTQYATQAPWPDGNPVKELLHTGLVNSSLDVLFRSSLPLIQAAIHPWLPAGIPRVLGS